MTITRLRLAMLSYSGSQQDLARAVSLPAPRISEYARGRRPIPPAHLFALAAELRVDPVDLVGECDETEMSWTTS